MARHLLTDRQVRNAKPSDRPYRLDDGDGLKLYVPPSGVMSWQFRYWLHGKETTCTLGKLSNTNLKLARQRAQVTRDLLAKDVNPHDHKREQRQQHVAEQASTFRSVAEKWVELESRRQKWTPRHKTQVERSLGLVDTPRGGSGTEVRRKLHDLPVTKVRAADVSDALETIEVKYGAPHMVEKIHSRIRAVLDHAVIRGNIPANPLPTLRAKKAIRRNYPAVTALTGIGEILRAARASDPCKGIQRAHALLVFTGMRVSEVVGAKWEEFSLGGVHVPVGDGHATKLDAQAGNWAIPRERMKRKDTQRGPHVVPLPPGLLSLLREWREADGERAVYVCPAPRAPTKPITPEAVEKHYRNALGLGGKHSPHSWRSAFSTVCNEAGKGGDVVEAQLDHVVGNKVVSAYDRAQRLELRRALLTWYERTLIAARDGAKVHMLRKDSITDRWAESNPHLTLTT